MKQMVEQILKTDIPQKYKPGLIEYVFGLDTEPNLLDMVKLGYTSEEYRKIQILVSIESMKNFLEEEREDHEFKFYHVIYAKYCIMRMIWRYNRIHFSIEKKVK